MSAAEKKIMKYFRRAVIDYDLLGDEQGVLVGLSGGKDSLTLLCMLKLFLRSSKYKYPLAAGYVDLGFGADITGATSRRCPLSSGKAYALLREWLGGAYVC